MKKSNAITHLFLDIGGVLLTNGWDHQARKRAATNFQLNWTEMEARHHLIFETYEEGKFTLEDYLSLVIFYKKQPFTRAQFRSFMFAQSKPYPNMIELMRRLKTQFGLKIVAVSNEARELNAHRIRKFKLGGFIDSFISSCFVQIRKPDAEMFRLALDIGQAKAEQVVYIDNTAMFVEIAEGLGIRSILHTDYMSTCAQLASFGLDTEKEPPMKPANLRILTMNGGSSSIKFAVFELADSLNRILGGSIDQIGLPNTTLRVKGVSQADNFSRPVEAHNHTEAVGILMDWIEERCGKDGLTAVGHRVVHGGPKYNKPQRITEEMVHELRQLSPFDPEHLPEEILLTEAFHRRFPDLPQVACFDTAFHHDLPSWPNYFRFRVATKPWECVGMGFTVCPMSF